MGPGRCRIPPAILAGAVWPAHRTTRPAERGVAGRIAWNISDKHQIFFRVTTDQGSQPTFVSLINPNWSMGSNQPSWTGQVTDTYTFNPYLTNQFLAAALYYSGIFQPPDLQAGLAASPTEFDQSIDVGTNALGGVGQANFFSAATTLGAPWI